MIKLIAFILLLIMVPAFGVTGGVILSFWNTGNELQPIWGRISGCVVVVVILFNLRNILSKPAMRATRKHRERMLMAIFSVIIFPMMAGFCLFMLEDFPLNSGVVSDGNAVEVVNEHVTGLAMKLFVYLPSAINCWYICLEGITPLWRKFKPVTSMNNND